MNLRDFLWQPSPPCWDARLRRWLIDRGSLTRRLQSRCRRFAVEVVAQRPMAATYDEGLLLGIARPQQALVREVRLMCDGRPVVFARSVLARASLQGPWRMVGGLGTRPLGAAVFADPTVTRRPLHYTRVGTWHALHRRVTAALGVEVPGLWARRSLFVRARQPLLVTEVFLPALLALAP
ncbi:MAG: chorismate--pyruvate lyase family protein [Burkholderiales bacterium]